MSISYHGSSIYTSFRCYKLLAIILSTLLLFLAAPAAFSEDLDLPAMSDADLIELLNSVQQEACNRGIERKAVIHPGIYVAGVDFAAGGYLVSALDGDSTYIDCMSAAHYKENGVGSRPDLFYMDITGTYHITLSEGDVIIFRDAVTLTICLSIVFE